MQKIGLQNIGYPIYTLAEIRAAEQFTFKSLGVAEPTVMELAGAEVARAVSAELTRSNRSKVLILVGAGNNGGDGLVAARHLLAQGYSVAICMFSPSAQQHVQYQVLQRYIAQQKTAAACEVLYLEKEDLSGFSQRCAECDVIVDAVYGTGFRAGVAGKTAQAFEAVNKSSRIVISIDLPSGLVADSVQLPAECIRATKTVVLQGLKPCLASLPAAAAAGEIVVADIQVSCSEASGIWIDECVLRTVVGSCADADGTALSKHKFSKGHVVVIGGSLGKSGAVKLCCQAAFRSGAGLVSAVVPESIALVFARETKEEMYCSLSAGKDGGFLGKDLSQMDQVLSRASSLVIGPGMGSGAGAVAVLERALEHAAGKEIPVVLDADALNLLAANAELFAKLTPHCVLTPHPGEMERISGKSKTEIRDCRVDSAKELAEKLGVCVVLKGARTVIARGKDFLDPHLADNLDYAVNPHASTILATAGSGDVLSGAIAGIAASRPISFALVCAAVFAHGETSAILAARPDRGLGAIAGEIADAIPTVLARAGEQL